MYLHIGNNIVIGTEEIIGIFDVNSLKKEKTFLETFNNLKKNKQIIDISEGKQKSYILINKEGNIGVYISNISSLTLKRRIEEEKYDLNNI